MKSLANQYHKAFIHLSEATDAEERKPADINMGSNLRHSGNKKHYRGIIPAVACAHLYSLEALNIF